jgi:hypothetical protein
MYKITLIPQIGVHIEGLGQVNFGDSKEKILETWGAIDSAINDGNRLQFLKYGCFVDLKKTDHTFEAIEFWNDYDKNICEVFIYNTEVLLGEAEAIKAMLYEKNNNEAPNDGWFVNIDVIYSGGSQKRVQAIIDQSIAEGLEEGEYKKSLFDDLRKAKHFTAFGIGYKGYCKDGLAMLASIENQTI